MLLISQRSGGQIWGEEAGGYQSKQRVKSQHSLMLASQIGCSCHLALS